MADASSVDTMIVLVRTIREGGVPVDKCFRLSATEAVDVIFEFRNGSIARALRRAVATVPGEPQRGRPEAAP